MKVNTIVSDLFQLVQRLSNAVMECYYAPYSVDEKFWELSTTKSSLIVANKEVDCTSIKMKIIENIE